MATTKSFVLPGDAIPIEAAPGKPVKIGPGLIYLTESAAPDVLIATKAGTLESNPKRKEYWVESNATRVSQFHPSRGIVWHY